MELFDIEKEEGDAVFSECGKYRYHLSRAWDINKPTIVFIGLNPSTATGDMDDPTIRRVKRFAKDWGYGSVYMMNLFAWISPYPKDLLTCVDPIGDNDEHLMRIADINPTVLFAWGNFKESKERAKKVAAMFPEAICLGKNKDGSPKHPLYIAANVQPIKY